MRLTARLIAALALALAATTAYAQATIGGIAARAFPVQRTAAQLPTANGTQGLRIVTDAASTASCTAGGGSVVLLCLDDGAWTPVGSGGAPAAHAASHQNGGGDELDLTGMSGLLATAQTPASHVHATTDVTSGTFADALISASSVTQHEAALEAVLDLADQQGAVTAGQLPAATTLARGGVVLSTSGEATAGEAVEATDARLTDARTPTSTLAHASSHAQGQSDALSGTLAVSVTGNASTSTALAANPTDCSAGQAANAIDASGNLTCAADDDQPDSDGEVPDALTIAGGTIGTSSIDLVQSAAPTPTAEGRVEWDTDDNRIAVGDGASTKLIYPGAHAGASVEGGAATTATALAANGTNCSAGNYPLGVDASGNAESCTAAGGAAAGSDTQVQFNDGGTAFGGDAGMTYNKTTDALTIAGPMTVGNAGISFTSESGTGISRDGFVGGMDLNYDGVARLNVSVNYILARSEYQYAWSVSNITQPPDTGIGRSAPGVAKFTNGATGSGTWQTGDPGTRPTCDSTVRGRYWHDFGGAGVADSISICCKNAADSYVWATALGDCT